MYLFWEKGYDATYISDLVETMGISRSTLYDSFGDKDELFKLVLEHYKNYGYRRRNLLFSGKNIKASLNPFFMNKLKNAIQMTFQKVVLSLILHCLLDILILP